MQVTAIYEVECHFRFHATELLENDALRKALKTTLIGIDKASRYRYGSRVFC